MNYKFQCLDAVIEKTEIQINKTLTKKEKPIHESQWVRIENYKNNFYEFQQKGMN